MYVAGQGSMIINGQRVDGRTLSFGSEGVVVGNGEEEQVVVPCEFDFAEDSSANEDSVIETADAFEVTTEHGKIVIPKNIFNRRIKKKSDLTSNQKLCIAMGAALCAGIAIGGVIFYRKKGK